MLYYISIQKIKALLKNNGARVYLIYIGGFYYEKISLH